MPRSPQGHPVIIQAGASGRGKRFAGRWGEVIFSSQHTQFEFAKRSYAGIKEEAARAGRDPGSDVHLRRDRHAWSAPPKPKPKTRWR